MVGLTSQWQLWTADPNSILSNSDVSTTDFTAHDSLETVVYLAAEGAGNHCNSDSICNGLDAIARCPARIENGGLFDRCRQANPLDAFSDE